MRRPDVIDLSVAAAGSALVAAAWIGLARGGPVDGFIALGAAGLMILAFAIRLWVDGEGDESESDLTRATTHDEFEDALGPYLDKAFADPKPGPTRPFWCPQASIVAAITLALLLGYFVLRVWGEYPAWFTLGMLTVVSLLLGIKTWISRIIARRSAS